MMGKDVSGDHREEHQQQVEPLRRTGEKLKHRMDQAVDRERDHRGDPRSRHPIDDRQGKRRPAESD